MDHQRRDRFGKKVPRKGWGEVPGRAQRECPAGAAGLLSPRGRQLFVLQDHHSLLFSTSSDLRVPCLLGPLLCCHTEDALRSCHFPFEGVLCLNSTSAACCPGPAAYQGFLPSDLATPLSQTPRSGRRQPGLCGEPWVTERLTGITPCDSASPAPAGPSSISSNGRARSSKRGWGKASESDR